MINIANVIGRYVFSAPIFWAEEVLVFMVIWAVFLSAVAITFNGGHLSMDLFYAQLKPPWRRIVNVRDRHRVPRRARCLRRVQSYKVVMLYIGNGNVSTAAEIPLVHPARRAARRLQPAWRWR